MDSSEDPCSFRSRSHFEADMSYVAFGGGGEGIEVLPRQRRISSNASGCVVDYLEPQQSEDAHDKLLFRLFVSKFIRFT